MVTQFAAAGISEMSHRHRRGRKLMTVAVVARVAVSCSGEERKRRAGRVEGRGSEREREIKMERKRHVSRPRSVERAERGEGKKAAVNRCRFIVVN